VTLGDGYFRKSLMKMIYRKLSKTASPPVTCHPLCPKDCLPEWDGEEDTLRSNDSSLITRLVGHRKLTLCVSCVNFASVRLEMRLLGCIGSGRVTGTIHVRDCSSTYPGPSEPIWVF
jgi:hypothetical protein